MHSGGLSVCHSPCPRWELKTFKTETRKVGGVWSRWCIVVPSRVSVLLVAYEWSLWPPLCCAALRRRTHQHISHHWLLSIKEMASVTHWRFWGNDLRIFKLCIPTHHTYACATLWYNISVVGYVWGFLCIQKPMLRYYVYSSPYRKGL